MPTIPTCNQDGLRTLTLDEIQENMRESVAAAADLGPEVSTGAHTILGMDLDATAIELEQLYRLLDDIWAAGDVDAAEGVQQDNLNRLRGAVRKAARKSTAPATCTGVNGTVIPAGSKVAIPNGGARWLTNAEITIAGGSTDVTVTAEHAGPVEAAIGAITEIVDSVSGWNTVNNAVAAELGDDVESDADYRNRSERTTTGSTTEEAIYTRLSEQDDIDAVVVVSNRGDVVDANGTDPHTMWIVIHPNTADQQSIAEIIWGEAGAAGGIGFRGAVTATVIDANEYNQQIKWDWASAVDLWISIVGTKDGDYPAGGDDLVRDAVTAYFADVQVGQDVYPAPIAAAVVNAVPGIMMIEARLKIGSAPGAGDTAPIEIAINKYADLNATIGVMMT